jgi:hypothetical protein
VTGNVRAEIRLPFGLAEPDGQRARTAVLTAITGHGELYGADDPNPFRAALHLLAASLCELEPYRGADVSPAVVGRLLPIDRDYLLLQLHRLTFGDVRYQTVECPEASCGRRLDIRFELSSVDVPALPDRACGVIELPGGRLVRYRLPLAADQAELYDVAPAALEAAFLGRCAMNEHEADRDGGDGADRDDRRRDDRDAGDAGGAGRDGGAGRAGRAGRAGGAGGAGRAGGDGGDGRDGRDGGDGRDGRAGGAGRDGRAGGARGAGRDRRVLDGAELLALPPAVRAAIVQRIVAASPALDLAVPLTCLSCGKPFRFVFDPVRSLRTELQASRAELVKQVHRMALSYHWSQSEILGLSRPLRHQYLELLQDEAAR